MSGRLSWRVALIAAAGIGLGGCYYGPPPVYAYAPGYYYPGYYPGYYYPGYYYGPPVYGSVFIGGRFRR